MKCRSLTNVIGNCPACIVICTGEKALDRDTMRRVLSGAPAQPGAAEAGAALPDEI